MPDPAPPPPAVTPTEYLAGLRQGSADRDGEVALLNAVIRELAAEKMATLAALRELLSGHDSLYRAHWAHLPACDPTDDIAAKAARQILDADA